MAKNNLIFTVIVAIIIGTLGFYGGTLYQKSKKISFGPGQMQNGLTRPNGIQGKNGNFQSGRPISGEIISLDNNTLTLKTKDGSSKIIIYSDSTKVNKTLEGSKDDLKDGEEVMVIGTEGGDGTITAQTISVGSSMVQQGMPDGQLINKNN